MISFSMEDNITVLEVYKKIVALEAKFDVADEHTLEARDFFKVAVTRLYYALIVLMILNLISIYLHLSMR